MYSTENEEQPSSSVTFVQLGSDPVNSGASGGAVGGDPIVNMTPDQISQLENVLRSENLIEGKGQKNSSVASKIRSFIFQRPLKGQCKKTLEIYFNFIDYHSLYWS